MVHSAHGFFIFLLVIQTTTHIYGRIYNVNHQDVQDLKTELLADYQESGLLNTSIPALQLAANNFTESVERIAGQYLVHHDSIRYSSQPCAKDIKTDSLKELKDAVKFGHNCVREFYEFWRRSSSSIGGKLNTVATNTYGECLRNFEQKANGNLYKIWTLIKVCGYQEIGINTVDLDPTGISARIRGNINGN